MSCRSPGWAARSSETHDTSGAIIARLGGGKRTMPASPPTVPPPPARFQFTMSAPISAAALVLSQPVPGMIDNSPASVTSMSHCGLSFQSSSIAASLKSQSSGRRRSSGRTGRRFVAEGRAAEAGGASGTVAVAVLGGGHMISRQLAGSVSLLNPTPRARSGRRTCLPARLRPQSCRGRSSVSGSV